MRQERFDLLVVGAEPAGFAAAACAAADGARVALVRAGCEERLPERVTRPRIPDAIWRRLDLHRTGLVMSPAPARVSLLAEGRTFATYPSALATREKLKDASPEDGAVLHDFLSHLSQMRAYGEPIDYRRAGGVHVNGVDSLKTLFSDPKALRLSREGLRPAQDLIEDFFQNGEIRTHFAAAGLMPAADAPRVHGSARAAAAALAADMWPCRPSQDGPGVSAALLGACRDAGVRILEGELADVDAVDARTRRVAFTNGEQLCVRFIVCATPYAARATGLRPAETGGAFARSACVEAVVRMSLSRPLSALAAGEPQASVFYIADSVDELQEAYDAAILGDIAETQPLVFEVFDDEVIARAPFCPQMFRDGDRFRSWSAQDRQALSARVVRRLSQRIEGFDAAFRHAETRIFAAPVDDDGVRICAAPDDRVVASPPHADDISAAVAIVDRLLSDE